MRWPIGRANCHLRIGAANRVDGVPLITHELIDAGRSDSGVLSRGQIRLLTGSWCNGPGWEKCVLGKEIDDRTARLFLRKFDVRPKTKRTTPLPDTSRAELLRRFGARRTKGICG